MATPRAVKRFFQSAFMRRVLCGTIAGYIRLVWNTGKWTIVNDDVPDGLIDEGRSAIVCFWHGRLLMMPHAWRWNKSFFMLSSPHPDGQIIAQTVNRLGIRTIYGSNKRGGSAALREMIRTVKNGDFIGVTPDGPRGPGMKASTGVVNIARLTGAPLLPIAFSSRRGKVLGSWDRFFLARPFGGGTIVWGDLLEVPKDLDEDGIETVRQQLEDGLNRVTAEADRLCGRAPMIPENPSGAAPS